MTKYNSESTCYFFSLDGNETKLLHLFSYVLLKSIVHAGLQLKTEVLINDATVIIAVYTVNK